MKRSFNISFRVDLALLNYFSCCYSVCVCVCVCVSRSVVSDSLLLHGLQPVRLLHPRNSPGKNTGVGCHFLLQSLFFLLFYIIILLGRVSQVQKLIALWGFPSKRLFAFPFLPLESCLTFVILWYILIWICLVSSYLDLWSFCTLSLFFFRFGEFLGIISSNTFQIYFLSFVLLIHFHDSPLQSSHPILPLIFWEKT